MSTSNLIRWSGLAAILSAVLLVVGRVLVFTAADPESPQVLANVVLSAQSILMLFGLMGIYGCQNEEAGVVGFLGFLLAITGTGLILGLIWLDSGAPAATAAVLGAVGGNTLALGLVLLGIGSWKANKLPRWTAVLWVIGVVVYIGGIAGDSTLVILIGVVVLGLGLVGAGARLWSEKGVLAAQLDTG